MKEVCKQTRFEVAVQDDQAFQEFLSLLLETVIGGLPKDGKFEDQGSGYGSPKGVIE